MSWERSATQPREVHGSRPPVGTARFVPCVESEGVSESTANARDSVRAHLHSAFCILNYASTYGLAGSMSTAMPRHLP